MPRGGRHPGSGRKKMKPEDKRVNVTLSVSPDVRKLITVLQEDGINISREFGNMITNYCKKHGVTIADYYRLMEEYEEEERAQREAAGA